jgi:hypothetical protein
MQTQQDDFPYTSDDPNLAPIDDNNALLSLTSQQLGDLKATMRLVIGSTLNGKDVYFQQLKRMQAVQESVKPGPIQINEDETLRDQLRYLLLGILFETPDVIQRSLVTVEQASAKVYGLFSRILSPLTNSWAFSPVKSRVDVAAARGEKVIDRLIMKGRVEEQNSRLTIQQDQINDLINELVDYIVLKTEIRQIIQEAGVNVAGDVVGEFQEQSATVDTIMEQKLKSIFRKRAPSQPGPSSNNPAEGK